MYSHTAGRIRVQLTHAFEPIITSLVFSSRERERWRTTPWPFNHRRSWSRRNASRAKAASSRIRPTRPEEQLKQLNGWRLTHDGQRIRKDWKVKNFMAGMEFFNRCAELAEADGHHPDLHIEGYRNVSVELWTHAIGGLSENDFILAAKIDELPIEVKAS